MIKHLTKNTESNILTLLRHATKNSEKNILTLLQYLTKNSEIMLKHLTKNAERNILTLLKYATKNAESNILTMPFFHRLKIMSLNLKQTLIGPNLILILMAQCYGFFEQWTCALQRYRFDF